MVIGKENFMDFKFGYRGPLHGRERPIHRRNVHFSAMSGKCNGSDDSLNILKMDADVHILDADFYSQSVLNIEFL